MLASALVAQASMYSARSLLQPHHQHLAFGIAEAAVVFDQLGAFAVSISPA
jgi:hypothetical protein